MFCVFLKEFNAVACIKSIFARLSSVGKKILFEKTVMSIFCSFCTGRNQGYIFAHDITDYVLYNRVVSTAEDERINAFCLYRCKVFFSSKSCDFVIPVSIAVFNEMNKKRTRISVYFYMWIYTPDSLYKASAFNCSRRSDNSDFSVFSYTAGCLCWQGVLHP